MTRAGPDVVCLSELRRCIFSSEYVPEQTRHGAHILKFTTDHGKSKTLKARRNADGARSQTLRTLFEPSEISPGLSDDIDGLGLS